MKFDENPSIADFVQKNAAKIADQGLQREFCLYFQISILNFENNLDENQRRSVFCKNKNSVKKHLWGLQTKFRWCFLIAILKSKIRPEREVREMVHEKWA